MFFKKYFIISLFFAFSFFNHSESFAHGWFSNTAHTCRAFSFHDGVSRDEARNIIPTGQSFYDEKTVCQRCYTNL